MLTPQGLANAVVHARGRKGFGALGQVLRGGVQRGGVGALGEALAQRVQQTVDGRAFGGGEQMAVGL